MELKPGDVFANHLIEEVAGRGGMGVVYRARHLELEIPVALKVIAPESAADPAFRRRFRRESRLAVTIDHPHVLPIRHAGEEEGRLFITMRFVEGTDLARLIARRGRLDPQLTILIGAQMAGALGAAHERGLIHRDVKPANVLIERRAGGPHAWLGDFGLTRRLSSDSQALTKAGQFVGTVNYISPEQIRDREVDGRADLYSLGCVLYQALGGSVPFPRDNEIATMYAHLEAEPASLADVEGVTPELEAAVMKALSKRPEDRFESAEAMARELERLRDGTPAAALLPELAGTGADAGDPTAAPGALAETRAAGALEETRAARLEETRAAGLDETRMALGGAGGGEAAPASPGRGRMLAAVGGAAAVAVVVLALLLGGGGDDSDPDPGGAGAGSARPEGAALAAFREEADSICTDIESGVEEAFASFEATVPDPYDAYGGGSIPEGVQIRYVRERIAIVRAGLERLAALRPPPSIGPRFREYVLRRTAFVDELERFRAALEAGDTPARKAASERMDGLLEQKRAAGRRAGLMACADDLPPGDERQARELGAAWVTGDRAGEICRRRITSEFLDGYFGGSVSRCVSRQRSDPPAGAGPVSPVDVMGVSGVHASVTFRTGRGEIPVFFDGAQDGWKVDGTGRPR